VSNDARADVVSRHAAVFAFSNPDALVDTFLHHRARSYTVDECPVGSSQPLMRCRRT
jgi:hypothetical protein